MTDPRSVDIGGRTVLLADDPHDLASVAADTVNDAVIVCAAPATLRAARALLRGSPWLIVLHDGGVGKDGAGVAGLARLADVGQAAVAVGHDSARVGDAADVLAGGVIVHVNRTADAMGLTSGPLRAQLEALAPSRPARASGTERVA